MPNIDEVKFPINRADMYFGEIINSTNTKNRSVIFTYPNLMYFSNPEMEGDPFFTPFNKEFAIDLNYCSPKYGIGTPKQPKSEICYNWESIINLDFLLEYFGFGEKMYLNDYLACKNTLFNGRFPYENYSEFGYVKMDKSYWNNGSLIENASEKYNPDFYTKKSEKGYNPPSLLSRYFALLCKVDYLNPDKIFLPFEEEGPIRKRTLESRNENE